MDEELHAYYVSLEPKWNAFLDQLADLEHLSDPSNMRWRPEDEAWYQARQHLDHIAAAYVGWQAEGVVVNEWGPGMDDARLLELIEPYIRHESSRTVFLATCQQFVREWKERKK